MEFCAALPPTSGRAADGASLSKIIEPLRGVHDILPAQISQWQFLESITREVFAAYGYEEFRVPVIEQTQLFKRSIGDFTDIVEKEMFSFVDQGDDHITLRPESGAWGPCSAASGPKRVAIVSFTRSMPRPSASQDPTSMRR